MPALGEAHNHRTEFADFSVESLMSQLVMNEKGVPIGQIAVDEFGNPFIIMRDQASKTRLKGLDALKANIHASGTPNRQAAR